MQDLSNWTPRPRPTNASMKGRHVAIAPFDAERHGKALWEAFGGSATNDYLYHFGWPRMETAEDLVDVITDLNETGGFVTCVFCDPETGMAEGMASYMRIDEANGVVEVGAVAHGAPMAHTPAGTEAHYLMARRVFDELGYRRYEWKLNAPNEASHRAARRFGFVYEGVFRQHQVKPYGNRDTAWYSMIDSEWPLARAAFETWLAPENFDADGRQRVALSDLTALRMSAGAEELHRVDTRAAEAVSRFQARAYERTAKTLGVTPLPVTWDYAKILTECEVWQCGPDEAPKGMLVLSRKPRHLYLDSIATAEAAAGSGIGGAMMDAAFERARKLRLPEIRLITHSRNPALAWYKRRGFAVEREEDMGDHTAVHMVAQTGL